MVEVVVLALKEVFMQEPLELVAVVQGLQVVLAQMGLQTQAVEAVVDM
jgi:hypothetical protein